MGNYLKMAHKQQIQALLALGWSYRRIERETGVRRETVARYASVGDSKPAKVPTGSELEVCSRNQAEPYRQQILAGLKKHLTAQRIYEDLLLECGYGGSYDSVKRLCRKLRKAHREVVGVMHSAPGQEAQVDFFAGPMTFDAKTNRLRRPHIFVMTLCCSRHSYEEAVFDQKAASFIRCHEHAFKEFGGVPRVVRLDNLKSGVTRACLYDPDVAELFGAFAKHYGFAPLPCLPDNAKEKGKVERNNGYIKNALKAKRFDSLCELNDFLRNRNRTISSLRIHGTTKKQVISHFLEVEQPALLSLPDEPFSLFEQGQRTVHQDGHVQVKDAFYSVPHQLVGKEVTVRFDDRLIRVLDEEKTVAVHIRTEPGHFSTSGEHRPRHRPADQAAYLANLFGRAERIGPDACAWSRAAEARRGVRSYRLIQGMLSFCRKYPKERVNWACRIAHDAGQYRYRTLLRLLGQTKESSPDQMSLTQSHELIRPLTDYRLELGDGP